MDLERSNVLFASATAPSCAKSQAGLWVMHRQHQKLLCFDKTYDLRTLVRKSYDKKTGEEIYLEEDGLSFSLILAALPRLSRM